ncbi:hypothetical protein GCM10011497_32950 [Elstera cyanobacteriorum]|uniref:Restriction endonuclease n=1 Tax=Elstera cyanobacteriorum TaxID=2022747 RepID=A0A255XUJ8_9PROT|nr:BglII/BstYI family type II restriction endonuclease [Elstera cyanobacteriorum]OYQ20603.1 hypothetical protein CHR90_04305 [Elstera cyanobacteriorum]GFZ99637.1 hypothetical protein GCM10011497_32950 [Elstera cyanobacteriorum]
MSSPGSERELSAKDVRISEIFTSDFLERFEVHSYRNASHILAAANPVEIAELIYALTRFHIDMADILTPGGNKSDIAKRMDKLLNPLGWWETRVQGDLLVRKIALVPASERAKSNQKADDTSVETEDTFRIASFIDGHKIDFVKNRVAFDMEWNSKDQTFDRDLYAARTFYDCGLIDGCILLTRSRELNHVFDEIGRRTSRGDFRAKYGASTTWMGKLLYRLDAGRAGGCPILALGIRPAVIRDFQSWMDANPISPKTPNDPVSAG